MSLLNVPYIGEKNDKTFLRTVSIKRTVAKKFIISERAFVPMNRIFISKSFVYATKPCINAFVQK